jgi:pimeloyl-ACP methyl ester carboxylesterase
MVPAEKSVRYLLNGAFYRMDFTDWGDERAPVVVCVHGLTRNGRDFDPLAKVLAERFRVVCPDLPGRGSSEWLPEPLLYQPLTYVQALAHLLASIGRDVVWVGTSLGGICGMLIAAMAGQPIRRLVLNDIGPFVPKEALARIGEYVGAAVDFADSRALETYLRRIHAPFGPLTDAQWAHLARFSSRLLAGGRLALHYDPAIAEPLRATPPADIDIWPVWEKIAVPRLVVRGEASDILLPETFARMLAAGALGFTVAEAGHAPALMDAPTIAAVRAFLEAE